MQKLTFGYWENGDFHCPENYYYIDFDIRAAYDKVAELTQATNKVFRVVDEDTRQAICGVSHLQLVDKL